MKTTPATKLFALSRPSAELSLAAMVDRLAVLQGPPKSPEHLAAEARLDAARAVDQTLTREFVAVCQKRHALEQANRDIPGEWSGPRMHAMEAALHERQRQLQPLRDEVAVHSSQWRAEYGEQVFAAAEPVRQKLHNLIDDIDSCCRAFQLLSDRLLPLQVSQPWVTRALLEIAPQLAKIRGLLEIDRDLIPALESWAAGKK